MYYVGVDVGGTNLAAGLVDGTGHILNQVSCPVDKTMGDRELCAQLARLTQTVIETGGRELEEIQAVGVGFPGQVDNETGVVIRTPNLAFGNTPFRALFQQTCDLPVFLGNDANCAAIGEYMAGAARGCDPAVVVTIGTGLGGGMISRGKLFAGFAGSGMEVGHMIVQPDGARCNCGNRGCWEQYGSATALIRLTQEEMEGSRESKLWELCEGDKLKVTGRTAFAGARLGDAAAKRVLDRYLRGLSVGIINLVNVIQPEIICLGGGVSNAEDDLLLAPLRELVNRGSFDRSVPTRLEKASLGNDAGIVGAALLCNML